MLILLCTAIELLLYERIFKYSINNWQDCKQAIFTNKIMNLIFLFFCNFFFTNWRWMYCMAWMLNKLYEGNEMSKAKNKSWKCKERNVVRTSTRKKKAKLLRKCQSRNGTSENQNICFGTNLLRHVFLLFVYNENTMTFN